MGSYILPTAMRYDELPDCDLFHAKLVGPGKVWLQSLPLSRLADRITSAAKGSRREEGSVLDRAFGLGDMIDGKN